ncbi:MAG: hypothetical protein ACTS4Y_00595 [Candidatus Hodgkinia cicadicola]
MLLNNQCKIGLSSNLRIIPKVTKSVLQFRILREVYWSTIVLLKCKHEINRLKCKLFIDEFNPPYVSKRVLSPPKVILAMEQATKTNR